MDIRALAPLLVLSAAGCGGFTITDAAQRIAFTRGCEASELTLVEGYAGGYALFDCAGEETYHCSAGRCSPASDARPNTAAARRVEEARSVMLEREDEFADCMSTPFVLQLRFGRDGRLKDMDVSPPCTRTQLSCLLHIAINLRTAPSEGEMLVSQPFGQDP